jgi:hypothetical protein
MVDWIGGNQVPEAALFAAVGSMVMLLFVEFGSRNRARLLAHSSFAFVILALLSPGRCAPGGTWLSTGETLVISFPGLFSIRSQIRPRGRGDRC